MIISVNRRLDQARQSLESQGTAPAGFLAPDIYDSWMRCISLGLDTRKSPPPEIVSAATLNYEHQRCSLVRGLALAEMHTLHQQIAGSNFMIAFANSEGLLLDVVCDQSFSQMGDAASIRPGSVWSEVYCGTNGLGTAAYLKRPIAVHGGEHFFARYNHLTCAACPVFAPDGEMIGILDASSDCLSRQSHTQALVAMAATQIENGLFREKHRSAILIAFHNRGEYLHTLSAGLMAVDADGGIIAANRAACALLHGLPASPGRRFADIFRTKFSAFVDEGRRQERQRLQDDVGSHFIATIENPRQFPMMQAALRPASAPKKTQVPQFVSADPAIAAIVRSVETAASRKLPILIRGETGTGKEQLARHAHVASQRAGTFVPVNCAALPESLIEAELFGYAEGAFTGARKGGSAGLFREADGGTLFLDEIGDMPVALQAVLLRFLDDFTVRPVGGAKRQVDVLLVSATNANLDQSIAKGRFRSDLLYRLNTLEVSLPPLRQRSDFGDIARHLLKLIDPCAMLTEAAIRQLERLDWSGNIRELRNILSRLTLGDGSALIDEEQVVSMTRHVAVRDRGSDKAPGFGDRLKDNLLELQRAQVLATFEETGQNVSKTARRLGVSRNTIYRTLRETDVPQGAH